MISYKKISPQTFSKNKSGLLTKHARNKPLYLTFFDHQF
ncbi:hypothetical protein HMPREF1040_0849 [Megasphaera sp. UPII 135-E]|nr:hypothetical protein HMPREF1040_0849 [Megasphaera sp. UPII 135-E]